MEIFETLASIGAVPFLEVAAGFTFVLLVVTASVNILFGIHDARITREIHRFIHEPSEGGRATSGATSGTTSSRNGFRHRLADATA